MIDENGIEWVRVKTKELDSVPNRVLMQRLPDGRALCVDIFSTEDYLSFLKGCSYARMNIIILSKGQWEEIPQPKVTLLPEEFYRCGDVLQHKYNPTSFSITYISHKLNLYSGDTLLNDIVAKDYKNWVLLRDGKEFPLYTYKHQEV